MAWTDGVWLRVRTLNSLVLSLRTTVRATRVSWREAAQTFSASRRISRFGFADGKVVLEGVLGGDRFGRSIGNHFARVNAAGELVEPETKAAELLFERRSVEAS